MHLHAFLKNLPMRLFSNCLPKFLCHMWMQEALKPWIDGIWVPNMWLQLLVFSLKCPSRLSIERRMTTTMLNKHRETPSNLSKYVSSSSMYKTNSVGERWHPCLRPMSDILQHVCHHLCEFLCRLWCTWLLQHVVNEVIPLIVGGVPKACHAWLCFDINI